VIPPIATHVTVAWSVRLYVFMPSVAFVLSDKAVGRNEMPFDRDTRVVLRNIVLDRGPGTPWKGEILGVRTPSSQRCGLMQITLAVAAYYLLIITKTASVTIT